MTPGQEHPQRFPAFRGRRLRRGHLLRQAVADVTIRPDNLILPLFVRHGRNIQTPVASMPNVHQMSPDVAVKAIRDWQKQGLYQFILFGIVEPGDKDPIGSPALSRDNPVCSTIRQVREAGLDVLLHADLCFCEYTDHGHCGHLCNDARLTVDNDATLPDLGQQAVVLAEAGADVIAPSGMMDGMVQAIRTALDQAGHPHTAIMSYAIKYASSMYGPFRDAAQGGMQFGDRRGYQMDYRRSREWAVELATDQAEGADIVMVKPAAMYLDIIHQVRQTTALPVAAYHVSGEYSMLHAAAERGWLDLKQAALETTYAIRRAGADLVLTYFAPQLLEWV